MKLWVMSDLHVDIADYVPPTSVEADLVLLAGDIAEGEAAMRWARAAFGSRPVLFVAGNHEYYGYRVAQMDTVFAATNDKNWIFLQEREFIQDDVRFLGCTLWTDFQLFGSLQQETAKLAARRVMADFRAILADDDSGDVNLADSWPGRSGNKWFTVEQSIALHYQHRAWLEAKLAEPFPGKTVVITHHAPARPSLHAQYANDLVSAGFINDLSHLMAGRVDLWLHGHTHHSFDYRIGDTRVLCNPRGYITRRGVENPAFDPAWVIEL
jgi:predicted phosphodiesterase